MDSRSDLYIVWNPFQRRAESLANSFDLRLKYFHFNWEERSKYFKGASYILKFYLTIAALVRHRPKYVFIQLAPTPLLYAVALYSMFSGSRYVSDCHNTMIYDDHWIRWPFAKSLLRRSYITLTHNIDVQEIANQLRIPSVVLRDPLPNMVVAPDIEEVAQILINRVVYVIVPCGMAADEPVEELFRAAKAVPNAVFVLTWFKEKLPVNLRMNAPQNILFTGFLPERDFNALYANANAALVLTTREGTQPSGAAEAIALGVPLVVSENRTTTRLYRDVPVFVQNEAASIAAGVLSALESGPEMAARMAELKHEFVCEVKLQTNTIERLLARE